jgi:hypothetical protein
VLSRLLDGSGYNILLAGDLGQGAPREIVLTARTSGGPQPSGNASPSNNNDDDSEVDAQPPTGVPPMQPHGAARGPQQMIEAQRRRDMMERLNSQNPQANLGADPATTNPAPN